MLARLICAIALVAAASPAFGEGLKWPNYQEADFVVKDYRFHSGESLPELKMHYRTLGTAKRDAAGDIVNAVLLLQGNTGTGANWLRPSLADELFAAGQPLDAAQHLIIMPDAIGRGGSSKPSDGLRAKFPHYRYHDMVDLYHRVVTDGLAIKRDRASPRDGRAVLEHGDRGDADHGSLRFPPTSSAFDGILTSYVARRSFFAAGGTVTRQR